MRKSSVCDGTNGGRKGSECYDKEIPRLNPEHVVLHAH